MKKLISICLLTALIFSLCASAAALTPEELYEKYAPVIDALEAGDFDAAAEALGDFLPEIEYEEVKLTEENFFDYFEVTTSDPQIERRASGEIKYIYPGSLAVIMKEEYYMRLDWENSTASLKVQAKKTPYRAKINFETGEINLGDKASDDVKKEIKNLEWYDSKVNASVDLSTGKGGFYSSYHLDGNGFFYKVKESGWSYWSSGFARPGIDTKYYQIVYSDCKVSDVKGTLYLAPAPAEEG